MARTRRKERPGLLAFGHCKAREVDPITAAQEEEICGKIRVWVTTWSTRRLTPYIRNGVLYARKWGRLVPVEAFEVELFKGYKCVEFVAQPADWELAYWN